MTNGSRAVLQRARKQAGALRDIYRRSHQRRAWIRARHAESPSFRDAVAADVAVTLHYRGEGRTHLSRTELLAEALRLTFSTDAFLAQVLYRGRVAALRQGRYFQKHGSRNSGVASPRVEAEGDSRRGGR